MAKLNPTVQKARRDLLRKLDAAKSDGGKTLSIYLDLDPTEFAVAPARQTQVNSVLNEASELVDRLDQEHKKVLIQDLELVRGFLEENDDWSAEARSIAIFVSSAGKFFNVVKLPEPIRRGVFIEDAPHTLPIKDILSAESWCVVLVDRRTARFFVGSPTELRELDETVDDVHSQHSAGGWSQARYERSVEEDVEDHLRNVVDRLLRLEKRTDFDHIVIGTNEELWPRIREKLHPYVAEDVIGRIDVDTQNADSEELQNVLQSLASQYEQQREQALIERLREGLGNNSRAAAGPDDVLRSLNEARVERLLVADGYMGEVKFCPKCGFLTQDGDECPLDGERLQTATLVDKASERTEEIGGETFVVRDPEALKDFGSIAAILRF
ncbi:MAG: hypothetical protein M3164_04975 [Actinomycetota bacterium]|nr:hypothetical protein [Actinomycetota bacterium]